MLRLTPATWEHLADVASDVAILESILDEAVEDHDAVEAFAVIESLRAVAKQLQRLADVLAATHTGGVEARPQAAT